MITLSEEILKMSEHEAKEILTDNLYKSKYYIYDNEEVVTRATRIFKNRFIDTTGSAWSLGDGIKPLSYSRFIEIKKNILDNYIKQLSPSAFAKYLEKAAGDIFGQENVEAKVDSGGYMVTLVIWFKEINIENSAEQQHLIRDLFVRIKFNLLDNKVCNLSGIDINRATYTERELSESYMFSHSNASSRSNSFAEGLCFGDTQLKQFIMNMMKNNAVISVYPLLSALNEYFKWESLEGTPYKRIDSVINGRSSLGSRARKPLVSQISLNRLITECGNIEYSYTSNYVRYENKTKNIIKLTNKCIEEIDEKLTSAFPAACFYRNNGVSYSNINSMTEYYKEGQEVIVFKGEVIKRKIIKDDSNQPQGLKIHCEILDEVVNGLEEKIYNKILTKKLEENYG